MRWTIAIFLLLIYSCDGTGLEKHCTNDSLKLDIPNKFLDSNYLNFKEKILKEINLTSLTKGFDKLQIRIWYGYPYTNLDQVLIFSQMNSGWKGEEWTINYVYNKSSLDSVITKKSTISPKCGWNLFIDSLSNFELLTLKDCSDVPGYSNDGGGNSIVVEFANCQKYRLYHYSEPWRQAGKFEEARKVTKINEIIERQLQFTRLYVEN